jgi:hypothetical protein
VLVNDLVLATMGFARAHLADASVSVRARLTGETADRGFAVACRFATERGFMGFVFSDAGIFQIHGGLSESRANRRLSDLQRSGVVRPGQGWSDIRVDCLGPQVRLVVNVTQVGQAEGEMTGSGQVGIGVAWLTERPPRSIVGAVRRPHGRRPVAGPRSRIGPREVSAAYRDRLSKRAIR